MVSGGYAGIRGGIRGDISGHVGDTCGGYASGKITPGDTSGIRGGMRGACGGIRGDTRGIREGIPRSGYPCVFLSRLGFFELGGYAKVFLQLREGSGGPSWPATSPKWSMVRARQETFGGASSGISPRITFGVEPNKTHDLSCPRITFGVGQQKNVP